MTPVSASDPVSKVAYPFTDVGQLNDAIKGGWIPLRPDGTPYKVQSFLGGYLMDGAPLNVWLGLPWYAGQQEALLPYWQNGQIPTPPAAILGVQVQPMPADVAANFATYQAQQADIFGLPWWAWAAGAAAYLLL